MPGEGSLETPRSILSVDIPPGFVLVPSISRPGMFSYYCQSIRRKYGTLNEAWEVYNSLKESFNGYNGAPEIAPGGLLSRMPSREVVSSSDLGAEDAVLPFVDAEFPPTLSSFGLTNQEDSSSSLRLSKAEKEAIRFIRLPQLVSRLANKNVKLDGDSSSLQTDPLMKPSLFGRISPCGIVQGSGGDCWLLATLASLAEFPSVIRGLFVEHDGIGLSARGKYSIRLYDLEKREFETVVVDDYIPCRLDESMGEYVPFFAVPIVDQLWVQIIEKAMAKFVGSYARLVAGHEPYAMIALTGFPQVYQFKRPPVQESSETATLGQWERGWSQWYQRTSPACGYRPHPDGIRYSDVQVFDKLKKYVGMNYVLCASITLYSATDSALRPDGLVNGHSYSLLDCREFPASSLGEGPVPSPLLRLVKLRNPHGPIVEWIGECSTRDSQFWESHEHIAREVGKSPSDSSRGIFWIPFETFARIFDKILVLAKCMNEPRSITYKGVRGGTPTRQDETHLTQDPRPQSDVEDTCLGVTMTDVSKSRPSVHEQMSRMSVKPFDPYLNAPTWIQNDPKLYAAWAEEKRASNELLRKQKSAS